MTGIRTAMVDRSLHKLAWLMQQPGTAVLAEHIQQAPDRAVYAHLQDMGLLALSAQVQGSVLCPDCEEHWVHPGVQVNGQFQGQFQGLCQECGWVDLLPQQMRSWQLQPGEVARRLQAALHLNSRYILQEAVPGILWRLGESVVERQRRVWLFAVGPSPVWQHALPTCAPDGAALVLSFEPPPADTRSSAFIFIPLNATLRFRKTGFVLDGLESYLRDAPVQDVSEGRMTSLHLLRSAHVALVDGQRISVPPDARLFLLLLLETEGEEMHKSELAERMGKAHNFKVSSVFRHCKVLLDTFVVGDERGRYRLAEPYCLNSEFEKGGGL